MSSVVAEDIGKLLLRLASGGLLLFHGSYKVFGEIQSTRAMVENAGLPGVLAYGSILGEFVAPLFLLLGYKARIAGIVMAINMLSSILIAHREIAFKVNDYWGWMIELNVMYMMGGICVALLGSGRYSLSRGTGKWD